jgi:hypothetical protein
MARGGGQYWVALFFFADDLIARSFFLGDTFLILFQNDLVCRLTTMVILRRLGVCVDNAGVIRLVGDLILERSVYGRCESS